MPRLQVQMPGAKPPAGRPAAHPADEDLDPTADEPRGLVNRTTDFLSGRYANRKARKRLQPPRGIAGRRG